jgi:hypothetical protein
MGQSFGNFIFKMECCEYLINIAYVFFLLPLATMSFVVQWHWWDCDTDPRRRSAVNPKLPAVISLCD